VLTPYQVTFGAAITACRTVFTCNLFEQLFVDTQLLPGVYLVSSFHHMLHALCGSLWIQAADFSQSKGFSSKLIPIFAGAQRSGKGLSPWQKPK